MLPLFRRERPRQLYVDGRVEFAVLVGFTGDRHAVAAQPEHLPVLSHGGNLQTQRLAGKCRHLGPAAEHGGRQRHRHARVQIATLPFEPWMRGEANPQVQIAGLCAARAHFAFAGHANARSVDHAGRNADINGARVSVVLDGQPPRRALVRILETELDFLLDVTAGALSARPPASSAPCAFAGGGAAKEGLEEIRKRVLVAEHLAHFVFGHRAELAAPRTAAEIDVPTAELTGIETRAAGAGLFVRAPVRPELVVLLALGRVAEDLVRLVDFLEPGLRRLVPGVDIGMVLARQLAVRLLDFLVGGGLGDTARRIV